MSPNVDSPTLPTAASVAARPPNNPRRAPRTPRSTFVRKARADHGHRSPDERHSAQASEDTARAPPAPVLLTVDETAILLRTTRKAIYALVERGQLGGVRRLGRRVLVHREELLKSLHESRVASPGRTRR